MGDTIYVNIDYDALVKRFGGMAGLNKKLSDVVQQEAQELRDDIRKALPSVGIRTKTGNLLQAVKYSQVNDLEAKVYIDEEQAPYAKYLEYGYSPFSMREGLLNGKSAKINKRGFRYARVPIEGKILTITEDTTTMKRHRGEYGTVGATRWHHPAYSGRMFFRQAIELHKYSFVKRIKETFAELTSSGGA